MDLKQLKKPLGIEDIDFRIQSINKGGYATILAYKDARVDMNRLDDVVGPENWQRDHKEIKNVVYCGIGIDIGEQEVKHAKPFTNISSVIKSKWVWKWDAGAESFTEKQKGEASDSFKRAGFNWGIGRELYDYPVIKLILRADEFKIDGNKVRQTWELKLKEWVWFSQFEDGKLTYLACKDEREKKRFEFGTFKNQ